MFVKSERLSWRCQCTDAVFNAEKIIKSYVFLHASVFKAEGPKCLHYLFIYFFLSHQDLFYHFIALLFYFAAFVLEAATTALADQNVILRTSKQYRINVAATVSLFYGMSAEVERILICLFIF